MQRQTISDLVLVRDIPRCAGISRATLFRKVRAGKFPPPAKVAGRNVWTFYQVRRWLERQGPEPIEVAAGRIIEKRDRLEGGFTASELRKRCWSGLKSRETVAAALAHLVHVGWLVKTRAATGGRPRTQYHWRLLS
jgi:predicted DNA-binding transcriptional regulator AlpA